VLEARTSLDWASTVRGTPCLMDSYGGGSMEGSAWGVDLTLRFLELA
jgi:hypothetical protein